MHGRTFDCGREEKSIEMSAMLFRRVRADAEESRHRFFYRHESRATHGQNKPHVIDAARA